MRYETVGEALKRTLWLLILPIAFVIASVVAVQILTTEV